MSVDSARVLEFPRLLEMLSHRCQFSVAAERALEIGPTSDTAQVRYLLAVTREAVDLASRNPSFTVGGVRDIRDTLERSQLGVILQPTDLREVLDTVQSASSLRRSFVQNKWNETYTFLAEFVELIANFAGLEADLSRTVGSRGEILDSASPQLGDIRREVRVAHRRLLDRLNRMIADTGPNSAIQEPIVTMREGRYVIPVRADRRSQVPGVVHGTSASGQTLFVEPMDVVQLNNQWREQQMAEEHEIESILRLRSQQISAAAPELSQSVEAVAAIDIALAKARLSFDLRAREPNVIDVDETGSQSVDLRQARHPLLPSDTVVPVDIRLGEGQRVLVVTGPNTGGKTVALKTVGLLAMMMQSGMFIPAADGSGMSVFDGIFADIGDEQSIEQSLSTFSSHMTKIIAMLRAAGPRSLILIDEIAAGTDPQEGSALARAIITALLHRGALAIATTHYSELKTFAYATDGVENASAEFDLATLRPTYRLITGVPGRSNALAIAQRLGLPAEIADDARSYLDPRAEHVDDLLSHILERRKESESALEQARTERDEARRIRREAETVLREAEQTRSTARQDALAELEQEVSEAREFIRRARRQAERPSAVPESLPETPPPAEEVKRVEETLRRVSRRRRPAQARPEPIRIGDWVNLPTVGISGEVVGLSDDGESVEVATGSFRLTQPVTAVRRESRPEPQRRAKPTTTLPAAPPVDPEIKLLGMRVHEVADALDRYLDSAARAGLPSVRIVHGKGTGALRSEVHEILRSHPVVERFQLAERNEGGEGATVAYLRV
ncbi:MAG: endonuclease MutS2 [Nitrolancea sp.]